MFSRVPNRRGGDIETENTKAVLLQSERIEPRSTPDIKGPMYSDPVLGADRVSGMKLTRQPIAFGPDAVGFSAGSGAFFIEMSLQNMSRYVPFGPEKPVFLLEEAGGPTCVLKLCVSR
jgi:hypothetical protein